MLAVLAMLIVSLAVVAGTGLLRVTVRTQQVPVYDNYFNSCRAALVVGEDNMGEQAMRLALTIEEEGLDIDQDDEVTLGLLNGTKVTLRCVDGVRRGDVHLRRLPQADIRLVTVYFAIQPHQLAQLLESDCRSITFKTQSGEVRRPVKNLKPRISQLVNTLTTSGVTL